MENTPEDWDKDQPETQSEDQQEDILHKDAPVLSQPQVQNRQNGGTRDREYFMRVLAIIGTVIVWIPFIFTIATSVSGTTNQGQLLIDYLMPAELFPIALIGSLMLVVAAQMARYLRKTIGLSFVVALVLLFGGQIFSAQSGLAIGVVESTSWVWGVIFNTIIVYTLAQILIAVAGIMLIRHLFKRS